MRRPWTSATRVPTRPAPGSPPGPDAVANSEWQLDGVMMHVVATAANGEVGTSTIFRFQQHGAVVSCRYAGGTVTDGFLLGRLDGNVLRFVYVQVDRVGRLDAGSSRGELRRRSEGRLEMIEHFRWFTRSGTGRNEFLEIDTEQRPGSDRSPES